MCMQPGHVSLDLKHDYVILPSQVAIFTHWRDAEEGGGGSTPKQIKKALLDFPSHSKYPNKNNGYHLVGRPTRGHPPPSRLPFKIERGSPQERFKGELSHISSWVIILVSRNLLIKTPCFRAGLPCPQPRWPRHACTGTLLKLTARVEAEVPHIQVLGQGAPEFKSLFHEPPH